VHVFKGVHWGAPVDFFNIQTHELGSLSRDGAVPDALRSCEVRLARGDIPWILDDIPTHSETDTMNFSFLRTDVHNKTAINDNLAMWDCLERDEEDCARSFNTVSNTLG
jgi:hypothetical protein